MTRTRPRRCRPGPTRPKRVVIFADGVSVIPPYAAARAELAELVAAGYLIRLPSGDYAAVEPLDEPTGPEVPDAP